MKTLNEAKELLRNSLYSDEFINHTLKGFSDETWLDIIKGAEMNTKYFYEWLNQVPQLKIYMDPKNTYEYANDKWNPALIFLNMLLETYKAKDGKAGEVIFKVMVLLFPKEILEPYIIYSMLKKVQILKLN